MCVYQVRRRALRLHDSPSTVASLPAKPQTLESLVSNLLGKKVAKDTLALAVASNIACRNPPAVIAQPRAEACTQRRFGLSELGVEFQ